MVGFRNLVLAAFPATGSLGISRACSVGGRSEHKEGRAWDWRVRVASPKERAEAAQVTTWLLRTDAARHSFAMARRLGVMYVIYNRRIWGSYRAADGWRHYAGANPHTDHMHISFSWPGARKQTSYWSGRPWHRQPS